MDGGEDYTKMYMRLMPLNCSCKNGYNGQLCVMYILLQ